MRWDLAYRVADAYYDLYLLERSIDITRDNRDLLIYLEQTIRKAYETGNAPYADLVRSQVEIGKLENDLESLIESRGALKERLNRLLHRPGTAELPKPRANADPQTLQPETVLRERLSDAAPDRSVLEAELQVAEERVRLADVEDRPDWRVGLAYFPTGSAINPATPGSGDDPVLASVSFKLPIGRKKYVAAERAAAARRSATLAELDSTDDRLQSALASALYRFRNADREIGLYRGTLLPKAEQSFEASEAGFRTGAVTVRDLVDAQQILLQFELSYERALSERGRAIAALERLVGGAVVIEAPGGTP